MLKKAFLFSVVLTLSVSLVFAQDRFYTKTGKITFYSKAPLEEDEAVNKTVTAVLDSKSGALQFLALMKSFEFEKALMQQHFNENYVESDKYPKAEFKGSITNNAQVNYLKQGSYPVKVKGQLTIHGVTKDIETAGTLKINNNTVDATSTFNVLLSDYKIKIPSIVKDKLSNTIKITVDCQLQPLKD